MFFVAAGVVVATYMIANLWNTHWVARDDCCATIVVQCKYNVFIIVWIALTLSCSIVCFCIVHMMVCSLLCSCFCIIMLFEARAQKPDPRQNVCMCARCETVTLLIGSMKFVCAISLPNGATMN